MRNVAAEMKIVDPDGIDFTAAIHRHPAWPKHIMTIGVSTPPDAVNGKHYVIDEGYRVQVAMLTHQQCKALRHLINRALNTTRKQ